MDLRIRRIFRPFSRVAALLLDRTNVTIKFVLSVSLTIALLGALSFWIYSSQGRSYFDFDLQIITIILVFLSGLLDEVTREFIKLKKKISELEGVGLGLDRYMDIPLVLGGLYLLQDYLRDTDFDLGFFNLSLRVGDNLGMAIAFLVGVYIVGATTRHRTNEPAWETRAERMFFLSAIMIAGYTHEEFFNYLFGGILTLEVILFLASIHAGTRGYAKEHHVGYNIWKITRPFKFLFRELIWGVKNLIFRVVRQVLRIYQEKDAEIAEMEYEEPADDVEYSNSGHNFTALVTDGETSQPIVKAKVTLKNNETEKVTKSTTNASGKSNFSTVVESQYVITVEAGGYKTEEFERFLSMDSGEVFTLTRHASDLSVVVTDAETSMPIKGSEVLLKTEGNEFKSNTDNLGVAYFKELELGSYEVSVEASQYLPLNDKIDISKENLKSVKLKRKMGASAVSEPQPLEEKTPPAGATDEAPEPQAKDADKELVKESKVKEKEKPKITNVLSESALVKYDSGSKIESGVTNLVDECINNGRETFIISTQPRTDIYRDRLRPVIDTGMVRIINLSSDAPQAEADEVTMSDLKSLKPIFDEMSAGSVLIFESLSTLIINEGGVVAYKFVSEVIQDFSAEGLCLVCLMDSSAHEESEISNFENLFVNLVKLDGDTFSMIR